MAVVNCDIYLRAIVALAIVIAVQAQGPSNNDRTQLNKAAFYGSGSKRTNIMARQVWSPLLAYSDEDNDSDDDSEELEHIYRPTAEQIGIGNSLRRCTSKSCVLPSGETGTWRFITECPLVLKNSAWQRPTICGYQNQIPIVCCPGGSAPLIDISSPTTNFECGKTNQPNGGSRKKRTPQFGGFIRGGPSGRRGAASAKYTENRIVFPPGVLKSAESIRNAWPWMALLGQDKAGRRTWFCSGVLLNHLWVISAAHCTDTHTTTVVRLGEHDYNDNSDGAQVLDVGVADVKYHPGYKLPKKYHDIVLIKLDRPINLRSPGVGPVCLPWGNEAVQPLEGSTVTITGWGATQFGGVGSNVLNEAEVTVLRTEVCNNRYSSRTDLNSKYPQSLGEESFCAIGDHPDTPSDSCQGDSGGPAVLLRNGRYTLVGIISYGTGCGKKAYPGIYASIQYPEHLAWIKKVAFSNY